MFIGAVPRSTPRRLTRPHPGSRLGRGALVTVFLLPLLTWMGGSEAKAYGTQATLISNPASPIAFDNSSTFTLTVTVDNVNSSSDHEVKFFSA